MTGRHLPALLLAGTIAFTAACAGGSSGGTSAAAPGTTQVGRGAADPAIGCSTVEFDCVDASPAVIPVAVMLTADLVSSAARSRYLATTNVRTARSSPLSLCSGDGRPGTRQRGHLDMRSRAFTPVGADGGPQDVRESVLLYGDARAAKRALATLRASAVACSATPAAGPFYRIYSMTTGPAVAGDAIWVAVRNGTGAGRAVQTTVLAFTADRYLVLVESPASRANALLAAIGRQAVVRVRTPPAHPVCDEQGCDSGRQHPTGLPPDVDELRTPGARQPAAGDPYWAVHLAVAADPKAPALAAAADRLRRRGYAGEQFPLSCDEGAAAQLGRSEQDFAITVRFRTLAVAQQFLHSSGSSNARPIQVRGRCRE